MAGCLLWGFLVSGESETTDRLLPWFLFIFLVPFVVFLEVLLVFLKKRKFWAWIAGVIVGALYAPSLFLPFGIMILVGLLAEGSRKEFGLGKQSESLPPPLPSGPPQGNAGE